MSKELLQEYASTSGPKLEGNKLGWIVLLNEHSPRNKRHYTPAYFDQAQAEGKYKGVKLYGKHLSQSDNGKHDPADCCGIIQETKTDTGSMGRRLWGLPELIDSHSMSPLLLEDARKGLGCFCVSHECSDWDGEMDDRGILQVQKCNTIIGLAITCDGGTTRTLYEEAMAVAEPSEGDALADEAMETEIVALIKKFKAGEHTKEELLEKVTAVIDHHLAVHSSEETKEDCPAEESAKVDPVKLLTEQVAALTAKVTLLETTPTNPFAQKYFRPRTVPASTLQKHDKPLLESAESAIQFWKSLD